jgi:hypothetical protein
MELFKVFEDLLTNQDQKAEEETTADFSILGFPFTVTHNKRNHFVTICTANDAARDDVVGALSDTGLQELAVDNLKMCLSSPVTFWLFGYEDAKNTVLLPTLSEDSSTHQLIIPGIVQEGGLSILLNSLGQTHSVHTVLTSNVALFHDLSLLRQMSPGNVGNPNFLLTIPLRACTNPQPLPRTILPLDQHFEDSPLQPLQIVPVRWARSGKVVTDGAFRIGLRPSLGEHILAYLQEIGLVKQVENELFDFDPSESDFWTSKKFNFLNNTEWFIERQKESMEEYQKGLAVDLMPADEASHADFLKALSAAGFDEVIRAVGKHFGWRGAVMTHLSLLAILYAEEDFESHSDFYDTGRKAYNVLVPLKIVEGSSGKELAIQPTHDVVEFGHHKYRIDEGILVGDYAFHATRATDYRSFQREYRFFAGLYLADVDESNKKAATPDYYMKGYPHHDADIAFRNAGKHWNPEDATIMLPTW